MMTTRLLFAGLLCTFSSAAFAGNPYVGVDVGVSVGRSNDIDEAVDYSLHAGGAATNSINYDDVFAVQYKRGTDVDVVAGWDFGLLRLEGELGHKRSALKRNVEDDITGQFLGEVNAGLDRTDGGTLAPLVIGDFQPKGSIRINTVTANALIDVGLGHNLTLFGGGGLGRSYARGFGGRDGAGTWQYIVGARYALRGRIDLGLKYRYFNSGMLNLEGDPMLYAGNGAVDARVIPTMHGRFRSRNVQLSLVYNFRKPRRA